MVLLLLCQIVSNTGTVRGPDSSGLEKYIFLVDFGLVLPKLEQSQHLSIRAYKPRLRT